MAETTQNLQTRGAGDPPGIEKYLKDIEIIKDLLIAVEEKPLVEVWAFHAWGILILLGSLIHYLTVRYLSFAINDLLVKVWTPVVIVGILLEAIAWARRMARESIPLFSRGNFKLFACMICLILSAVVVLGTLIDLEATQYLPAVIIGFVGVGLSLYSITCVFRAFYPALFLCALGLILFLLHPQHPLIPLGSGLVIGLTFIFTGFTIRKAESRTP